MEDIIYQEEIVREEVFDGTLVLDGHMTSEEQEQHIFDMMRMAGVPYIESDQYDIGYDGASDNEGISETQTTHFGVFHTFTKKVPYRVNHEEIFTGTYILDSISLTPEEQREKIFSMMEEAGVHVENKDELVIGYDGASDNEGISETQSTPFAVYRVTKTRVLSEEEQEEALRVIREQLQELRDKIGVTTDTDEIARIASRMNELSTQMDEVMNSTSREYATLEDALKQCDLEMKEIEDQLLEQIRLYNETFEKIQEIMKEQTSIITSKDVSAEVFEQSEDEFLQKKLRENDVLLSLKTEIDQNMKRLAEVKKKREKVKRDLDTAKALELSASEYIEIMEHMKKRNLVQAILETKGLSDIIAIPAKERTKEQERLLREARAEIRRELFEAKKENQDKSLSEIIEALYGIETEFQLKGRQRVLIVKPDSLQNIRDNAGKLPEKIISSNNNDKQNYVPSPAPTDMEHVLLEEKKRQDNNNIDEIDTSTPADSLESSMQDVITFYLDVNSFSKIYAQKYVFDRFHLEIDPATEHRIDNMICYEIDREAARYIVSNAKNQYSPYTVRFDSVSFGMESDKPKESTNREILDKIVVFEDTAIPGKFFVYKEVMDRFNIDEKASIAEYDGVRVYEIDRENVEFLESHADNNYSPYILEHRSVKISLTDVDSKENMDSKIMIYKFGDSIKFYVTKEVLDRFHLDDDGERVKIGDQLCFEIDREEADYINGNANNNYAPYKVEYREVTQEEIDHNVVLPYQEDASRIGENGDLKNPDDRMIPYNEDLSSFTSFSVVDIYTIYRDVDNPGKLYVRKPVFDRFNISGRIAPVRIDGVLCYQISENDVDFILGNANNSYSPYNVELRDVRMGRDNSVIPYNSDVSRIGEDGDLKNPDDKMIPTNPDVSRIGEDGDLKNPDDKMLVPHNSNVSRIGEDGDLKNPDDKMIPTNPEVSRIGEDGDLKNPDDKMIPYDDSASAISAGEAMVPYDPEFARSVQDGDTKKPDEKDIPSDEPVSTISPGEAMVPYDPEFARKVQDGFLSKETGKTRPRGLMDLIIIYRDLDENRFYVPKPVLPRFDIEGIGEGVRFDGILSFEISAEDAEYIVNNADNDLSPYLVRFVDVHSKLREIHTEPKKDDPKGDIPITIPKTKTEVYSSKETPVLYGPPPKPEVETGFSKPEPRTEIDTFKTGPVLYGPPPVDEKKEVKKEKEEEEIITLYRDVEDNNQVYAPKSVLSRFGITPSKKGIMINGIECFKISRDTDQIINSIAKMSHNPKLIIRYEDVHLKKKEEPKKPRPHVEAILDKLTTGLDIRAKDAKRYKASNLKIAKGFKQELSSGNIAYNIVHVVPAVLKVGVNFFRKLSGKLLSTGRANEVMREIEKRLSELSDEELEVLFEEYKGSLLKTDMNNQINPLILDRLREFGLHKVEQLNDVIKKDYSILFTLIGQVKALEEKIADDKSSKESVDALNVERKALLSKAAGCIREIIESRKTANNLLSSGVHGLEEDFKAVATKLSYVGMRFGRDNDFDNELQHQLGNFGRDLNEALASDNDEAIVQNFMGLESCYYKNTDIRGSLVGRRSVGTKYYSPIAEQFDYRDDPFIRDLLTTVAVSSAAVSAINAYRIHQIEEQRILSDNQSQASTVNTQNDATMQYVHDTGKAITDKRGTFREGMEAQARQDALTNAGVRERAHLDSTDWTFNNAYHAADAAGHAAYNQFYADVTSRIQDVASQYAQGAITQAEALSRMAQISNDAQTALRDVVDSSLAILKPYAASHPQFDLTAFEESMEYMIANPGAIAGMNQAAIDVTNLAEGLSSLQAVHMTALTDLPSDMASTIVAAASSCLLAWNVSQAMHDKTTRKNRYGNEITDMMADYVDSQEDEEEKSSHK